jgi:hypothetical protein
LRRTFDPSVAMVEPRLNALFAPPGQNTFNPDPQSPTVEPQAIRFDGDAAAPPPGHWSAPSRPVTAPALSRVLLDGNRSREAAHWNDGRPASSETPGVNRSTRTGAGESPRLAATRAGNDADQPESYVASPDRQENAVPETRSVRKHKTETSRERDAEGQSRDPEPGARTGYERPAFPRKATDSPPFTNREVASHVSEMAGDKRRAATTGDSPIPAAQHDSRKIPGAPGVVSTRDHEGRLSVVGDGLSAHPPLGLTARLWARPAHFREFGKREPERRVHAEPTIEVTIGRIDIRGPVAGDVPRTPAQPAKRASLEEYLRQRSGGRRE